MPNLSRIVSTTVRYGTESLASEAKTAVGDAEQILDENIPASGSVTLTLAIDPTKLKALAIHASKAGVIDVTTSGADELLGGASGFDQLRAWESTTGEANPFSAASATVTIDNSHTAEVRVKLRALLDH